MVDVGEYVAPSWEEELPGIVGIGIVGVEPKLVGLIGLVTGLVGACATTGLVGSEVGFVDEETVFDGDRSSFMN